MDQLQPHKPWIEQLLPWFVAIAGPAGLWLLHKSKVMYSRDKQGLENQRTLDTVMADVTKAGMQHASSIHDEWQRLTDSLRKDMEDARTELESNKRELDQWREKHYEQREIIARLTGEISALKARVTHLEGRA